MSLAVQAWFRLQASESARADAAQVLSARAPMELQGPQPRSALVAVTMWVFITHVELYDIWFPLGLDHGLDVRR